MLVDNAMLSTLIAIFPRPDYENFIAWPP